MSLLNKFKAFIGLDENEPGDPPAWIERLEEASYVSPLGQLVPLQYGDLTAIFSKKVTVFENANAPGAYIQDNGPGGHRFPMACYFDGDNHDNESKAFIRALLETGPSSLYHPIFGLIEVVPGGEIQYVSNLVSQANQTTVLVEFLEDTGLQVGDQQAYAQTVDSFNEASSLAFADKLNITDPVDESNFKSGFTRVVGGITKTLKATSTGLTNAQNKMDDIEDSMTRGIDLLVGQPLAIARQTQILINTPAAIKGNIKAKLDAYKNLAQSIFGTEPESSGYDFEGENAFALSHMTAGAMLSSSSTASLNNDYTTKKEFLDNAFELQALVKEFIDWSDQGFTNIDPETDTGDGYQELLNVINTASSLLINSSFGALTAYTIILDSDRGCQELCFELYGTSKPEKLDFFQSTNNLSGDEIFIIKEGREIVYYL